MKLWIDTEFNEYRGALISLALVAEDGREWYGVRYCDDPGWWVKEHVMPHLNQEPERDATLRGSLGAFLCSFDSVHIVSDWPGDIAHLCNFLEWAPGERVGPDCMTFEVRRDLPDTATTSRIPHNALEDARALARGATECYSTMHALMQARDALAEHVIADCACPCCGMVEACADDCTFARDDAAAYDKMQAARAILFVPEDSA